MRLEPPSPPCPRRAVALSCRRRSVSTLHRLITPGTEARVLRMGQSHSCSRRLGHPAQSFAGFFHPSCVSIRRSCRSRPSWVGCSSETRSRRTRTGWHPSTRVRRKAAVASRRHCIQSLPALDNDACLRYSLRFVIVRPSSCGTSGCSFHASYTRRARPQARRIQTARYGCPPAQQHPQESLRGARVRRTPRS